MNLNMNIRININDCISRKVVEEQLEGANMQSGNDELSFLDSLQVAYAESKHRIEIQEAVEESVLSVMAGVVMDDMRKKLMNEARDVAKVKAEHGKLSTYYDRDAFVNFITSCKINYKGDECRILDMDNFCNKLINRVYESAEKIGIEYTRVRPGCYCFTACIKP